MRGIGIVLMVLGHSGFPGTDFIYLFHMALFFMLSGWLFSLRGGPVHFIKRKAVTLWLPFVLANTAFTVLNNLFLKVVPLFLCCCIFYSLYKITLFTEKIRHH